MLPDSDDLSVLEAEAALEEGHFVEARRALRAIHQRDRNRRHQAMALVVLSFIDGQGDVHDLEEARRIDPGWSVPPLVEAWAQDLRGNMSAAHWLARQAVKLDPDVVTLPEWPEPADILFALTAALVGSEDGRDRGQTHPAVEDERGSWDTVLQAACDASGLERVYELTALRHLRQLGQDPTPCAPAADAWTLYQQFLAHGRIGDPEGAVPYIQAAARLKPVLNVDLAFALVDAGQIDEAYEAAEQGVASDGTNPDAHHVLSWAAYLTGRGEEGLREALEEQSEDPTGAMTHESLSNSWYMRGDFALSRQEEEESLRQEGDDLSESNAVAIGNLAELDMLEGHLSEGEERLNQAIEYGLPGTSWPYLTEALLYDVTGRADAARSLTRIAVEEDPHGHDLRAATFVWPELRLSYQALFAEAAGDLKTARQAWSEIRDLETSGTLHFEPLRGRAAAHLAELTPANPLDAGQ
jgi:tetratricopeptide (TPR) repeat protein